MTSSDAAVRTAYRTTDVAVRGGELRVGVWESPDVADGAAPSRVVLGLHGVTSSHLAWALVAQRVVAAGGTRFVAPDLRGRGRSNGLPGPWGMARHADDVHAVVGALGRDVDGSGRAAAVDVSVGHSMGGFVAVVHSATYPADARALVLVDGGVPLERPADVPVEKMLQATLGPAAERLALRFEGPEDYRGFWRRHPAFGEAWSRAVEDYVDYDLVDTADGWRSASRYDAVAEDSIELGASDVVVSAWQRLPVRPVFLRSPLGLLAEPPGLYSDEALRRFAAQYPIFDWTVVHGTNHYTVTLGDLGAQHVADAIAAAVNDD